MSTFPDYSQKRDFKKVCFVEKHGGASLLTIIYIDTAAPVVGLGG